MDDFYGDNKRGGNDDGFFTTPSNTPGFYKSAPRDLAAPLAPAGERHCSLWFGELRFRMRRLRSTAAVQCVRLG